LRIWGKKSAVKRGPNWIFQGDTYTNGFIEKDVRVNALTVENVNPALDEVSMFLMNGKDGADGVAGGAGMSTAANLEALAEAIRRPVAVSLQPGDHVEVFQGEQSGARGTVDSVMGDVVLIRGELTGLQGQLMEVPSRHVRKRFTPGEHVKVMSGLKVDETGMVVDVKGELVTFVSDLTEEEVHILNSGIGNGC
jgi:transcription elongation factor SPT5